MCTYVFSCRLNDICMHESFRRQSGSCICYVLYVSKGGPSCMGPQNPSEMGLMKGSKSLAFWSRGGPFRLGGPKSLLHRKQCIVNRRRVFFCTVHSTQTLFAEYVSASMGRLILRWYIREHIRLRIAIFCDKFLKLFRTL